MLVVDKGAVGGEGHDSALIRRSGLGARKGNSGLAGARGQRPEGRLRSGIDLEGSHVTGESTKGAEARGHTGWQPEGDEGGDC